MKHNQLLSSLFFCSFATCFSQVTDTDLIGSWTVEEVLTHDTEIQEEDRDYTFKVRDALNKSTFVFADDHRFTLNIPLSDMSELFRDTYWKWDHSRQHIVIQEEPNMEEDEGIMTFVLVQKKGSYFCEIERMPFSLKLIKS